MWPLYLIYQEILAIKTIFEVQMDHVWQMIVKIFIFLDKF